MAKSITDISIGSYVKDLGTLYNGIPIKWRILEFNHSGYPANTVTLIGLIDKKERVNPYYTTKEGTFRSFAISSGGTVGSHLDDLLNSFSQKLQKRIVPTPLDIQYSGGYSGYSPRFRKETHSVFLFGAGEYNHGSSTGLSNPSSQKYFKRMDAYSNQGVCGMLGLDNTTSILLRDAAISSSDYYRLYPGYVLTQYASYATSGMNLRILPVINISTKDLLVSNTFDTDGAYILNMIENKYLVQDGADIKKYSESSDWQVVGAAAVTQEMFNEHGMEISTLSSLGRSIHSLEELMVLSDKTAESGKIFKQSADLSILTESIRIAIN